MKKTQTLTLYTTENGLVLNINFHDRTVENESYVFEYGLDEKNDLYRLKYLLESICYNEHLNKHSWYSNLRINVRIEQKNQETEEWVEVDE